jgi:hypothetical protein
MNKLYLLKKVSAVHAIKCAKSTDFDEAMKSMQKLSSLKNRIAKATEETFEEINTAILEWAGQNPVVHESEITQVMGNKEFGRSK